LTKLVAIGAGDRGAEGRGRTALVTGASSGIGLALTTLLAAKGFNVVPVARRAERLQTIAENLSAEWQVEVDPVMQNLPAVPGSHRPRRTVEHRTEVVPLA